MSRDLTNFPFPRSQEAYAVKGRSALALTADFDERAVLTENLDYIASALDVRTWIPLLLSRCDFFLYR